MFKLVSQNRPSVVALDRTRHRATAQKAAYLRLLFLDKQMRKNTNDRFVEGITSHLPSICWPPFGVVDVTSTKRPPYVAAGYSFALFKQAAIYARSGKLWVYVDTLVGNRLKRSFTLNKSSKPRPFDFFFHGWDHNTFRSKYNPEYIEIQRRRVTKDAGLFADLTA